ncbi:alpha/beta hydrolase [Variovorax sp. Sphag1AA]|uniref:alpha/beta hydrolase n=1 Tax=Variovorax sp. Sphag1AA TaxID=2587027 RepID=UPI00161C834C|nr:alpha/beta hydrolase [Variovorax sp. Sphag1AA]MBB3178725.1 dienelactone hydrolase [Variovorax sp. Sphag1AA]
MPQEILNDLPQPKALAVERAGAVVPTVYWQPAGECRGVVLACHGGSGHKKSNAILMIARACLPRGLAVLAIDGPVQGDRRSDGDLDPGTARQSFREAWRAGVGRTGMGEDMRAALDALQRVPGFGELPVGYVGVSMGTAYGIPMLAVERRVRAAAIGLWSTTYAASEHLAGFAQEMRCDVWFTQQWDDEFFDREGTFALFDAIGSPDKRLVAYPGPHRELEGERLTDAIGFVAGRLLGQ